jgi:hypothetical protein
LLIALSTLEAEYIACSDAVRETKWLLQLAKDVDFHTTTESKSVQQLAKDMNIRKPTAERTNAEKTNVERTTAEMGAVTLYCDNQGAIKTIVSGTSKASTKHTPVLSTVPTSRQTRTRRIYAQKHSRHRATDFLWAN